MAYGSCKDLTKTTDPDKVLRDKAFKMVAIRDIIVMKED